MTPTNTTDAENIQSDAEKLSDELGSVSICTVEGNNITAPVVKIDEPKPETVRFWYRFPTGELVFEEFRKPDLWNPVQYKLARLIDYLDVEAESFSQLESSQDSIEHKVRLEKTTQTLTHNELEEIAETAPTHTTTKDNNNDNTPVIENLYVKDYQPNRNTFTTWESVDPVDLVDDDRYSPQTEEKSKDENKNEDLLESIKHFQLGMYVGIILSVVIGVIYGITLLL